VTRNHFDPSELDRTHPELERVAERLEAHAADADQPIAPDLVARIQAAVDAEPDAAPGWLATLASALGPWRRPAAVLAAGAIVVAIAVGSLAVGDLFERMRNLGASPPPSVTVTPSPSPSPSPTASPTPSTVPSPADSATPTPSSTPTVAPPPSVAPSPSPTSSDDHEFETPEMETPRQSDDSGGNSGPGSGDD